MNSIAFITYGCFAPYINLSDVTLLLNSKNSISFGELYIFDIIIANLQFMICKYKKCKL